MKKVPLLLQILGCHTLFVRKPYLENDSSTPMTGMGLIDILQQDQEFIGLILTSVDSMIQVPLTSPPNKK